MDKVELNTINWHTMSTNERSAWIYSHLENQPVSFRDGLFFKHDGSNLPEITLDRLAAIELTLSDKVRNLYVENVLNEMNARKDNMGIAIDAKRFYHLILTTPVDVRAVCMYHAAREDYV